MRDAQTLEGLRNICRECGLTKSCPSGWCHRIQKKYLELIGDENDS